MEKFQWFLMALMVVCAVFASEVSAPWKWWLIGGSAFCPLLNGCISIARIRKQERQAFVREHPEILN